MIFQTLNLILLTSAELHFLCTIQAQSFPWEFVEEEDKNYERKIILKGDGDGRDEIYAKVFSYLFHCWYYNTVFFFSLCLLAHAHHVEF